MPNSTLTTAGIEAEITSRLGGSRVAVELDQKDFVAATKEAIRIYARYRPFTRWVALPVTTAQKRYVLDLAQHPGFVGVIEVGHVDRRTTPSPIDIFDPLAVPLSQGDVSYGDIAQRLTYTEDAARVVSAEVEWHGDWEGSSYALYVDIVRAPISFCYRWAGHFTADANANTGMQLIPEPDVDWVLNYIEARCRITVGNVRRKFGGVPNSEGSTDETDGQQQSDEGREAITALLEEIQRRGMLSVPPLIE